MAIRKIYLTSALSFGTALAMCVLAFGGDEKPAEHAAFAKIKSLVGDWYKVGEDGKATEEKVTSYRLTAGGNVVFETLFAGTEEEMMTMYHMDGEDLVLTHYCMVGNNPHMVADRNSTPDKVVFRCKGGANLSSEEEQHMHRAEYEWMGEGHFKSQWFMYAGDENVYTASFELVRR